MSYAVEFRITLGTDDEGEAKERAEFIRDGVAVITALMQAADQKVEVVQEEIYTY